MPDTPYHIIDEAISHAEEIKKYFLDGGNPDNVNTTGYHIDNGAAVISSALIGFYIDSLPPGMKELLKEDPTLVGMMGIMPETIVADAGRSNIELWKAVYNDPQQVPQLADELITSLEELKKTPS